jgi:hypothetical protein
MSSTKDKASAEICAFFDKELVPAGRALAASHSPLRLTTVDPAATSYYIKRAHTSMRLSDFTDFTCTDGADFARRLTKYWNERGCGELVHLAASLGRLAELAKVSDHDEADVSPFVYVMF